MNKKRIIIVTIIMVLVIIFGLWVSEIIPKQIARISATNYLKKNFPEKQYEYVDIEWSSSFGGYSIRFKDENDEIVGFLMNNKYLPITPGQGRFGLEDRYRVEYEGISDINDFYNHSITSKYQDLRTLPENYSKEQAQKDNCFIIGAMVHNDNLYSEFMENYKNKKTAFIRVAQNTVEGDLILTDILYYEKSDKVYIVTDNTRDKFSAETDRIIELKEYNYISEYKNNNHLYWVL